MLGQSLTGDEKTEAGAEHRLLKPVDGTNAIASATFDLSSAITASFCIRSAVQHKRHRIINSILIALAFVRPLLGD
jgi:hypothetical protein